MVFEEISLMIKVFVFILNKKKIFAQKLLSKEYFVQTQMNFHSTTSFKWTKIIMLYSTPL